MEENKKNSRTLVGLWDCPYCGAKGLNGLKKHCPNCGHPQDEGTKFYLGEEKEYLSEEEAADYGKGADWTCAYCGALNRYNATECANCGAGRDESTGSYFENEVKQAEKQKRREEEIAAAGGQQPQEESEPPKKRRWLLLAVLAVLIGALVFTLMPRSSNGSVTAKEWTRVLYLENYEDVKRSDWSLPADATLISSASEIHHYDTVLDHYEDVQVRRSREVLDHYNTVTETVNNGDGTFTERDRQEPVYVTEYYYETERQPVYIEVPAYRTKYYYVHKEWVSAEPAVASGTTDEPYWPAYTESPTVRVSGQGSAYKLTVINGKDKTYTVPVTEALFAAYSVGDPLEVTVSAGNVTELDGIRVR